MFARRALLLRRPIFSRAFSEVKGAKPLPLMFDWGVKDEELGPSFVEKYQLNEPSRFVPLTLGAFGLATVTGIYHIDAETQLLVVWALWTGTVYSRFGPMIGDFLDQYGESILQEHRKAEQIAIDAQKVLLEEAKEDAKVYDILKELHDASVKINEEYDANLENMARHAARDVLVKRLDTIVEMKRTEKEKGRKVMVEAANKYVNESFTGDGGSKLKQSALDSALKILSNPKDAKMDQTVGKLYEKFFAEEKKKATSKKEMTAQDKEEAIAKMKAFLARENIDEEGIDFEKILNDPILRQNMQ